MIDTSSNMLYHISNLNIKSQKINYQIATGKNMEKGSDNSMLHADLIDLDDKLRVTEGLKRQIEKTKSLNDVSDTNISDMKKYLDSIKVDLMKSLNDGMDRSDKLALAANLTGIREDLLKRVNTQVNGEYVFSGSVTTIKTATKDDNFKLNGKVNFGGDDFVRKIAVAPGNYRDRGVTAFDVAFYNSDTADAGKKLTFQDGERIIDDDGHEWTLNDDKNRLQKRDFNGVLIEPKEEINVSIPQSDSLKVTLGVGANTDAKGDFTVKLTDNAGTQHKYTYTADGTKSATDILEGTSPDQNGLITQINNDFPDLAKRNGDSFVINKSGEKYGIVINDTDPKYTMVATNESETDGSKQSVKGTYELTVPATPQGRTLSAKHNYFDDLNNIINALKGNTTKLDGTKGPVADDKLVEDISRDALGQTSKQFDATNVGHGELGGRNRVFEVAYDKITTQETHYNVMIQEWGGADMAKLAMESKSLDITYQALYSTISKMNTLSLVNFLK